MDSPKTLGLAFTLGMHKHKMPSICTWLGKTKGGFLELDCVTEPRLRALPASVVPAQFAYRVVAILNQVAFKHHFQDLSFRS